MMSDSECDLAAAPDRTNEDCGQPARVLIADPDPIVRKSLGRILSRESAIEVVGESGEVDNTIEQLSSLNPDVAMIDAHLIRTQTRNYLKVMKSASPATRFIILSVYDLNPEEALAMGADAFLWKDCGRVAMVQTVRSLAQDGLSASDHAPARPN